MSSSLKKSISGCAVCALTVTLAFNALLDLVLCFVPLKGGTGNGGPWPSRFDGFFSQLFTPRDDTTHALLSQTGYFLLSLGVMRGAAAWCNIWGRDIRTITFALLLALVSYLLEGMWYVDCLVNQRTSLGKGAGGMAVNLFLFIAVALALLARQTLFDPAAQRFCCCIKRIRTSACTSVRSPSLPEADCLADGASSRESRTSNGSLGGSPDGSRTPRAVDNDFVRLRQLGDERALVHVVSAGSHARAGVGAASVGGEGASSGAGAGASSNV